MCACVCAYFFCVRLFVCMCVCMRVFCVCVFFCLCVCLCLFVGKELYAQMFFVSFSRSLFSSYRAVSCIIRKLVKRRISNKIFLSFFSKEFKFCGHQPHFRCFVHIFRCFCSNFGQFY